MKVIAVVNNKGGVGKTFTSVNLAVKLAAKGPTIAIDNDSQGNLSSFFAVPEQKAMNTTASLYKATPFISGFQAYARYTLESEDREPVENLFVSTACEDLAGLQRNCDSSTIFNLSSAIKKAGDEYEYCVIDCPPGKGVAQEMALYAADIILVPMAPETPSIDAVNILIGTLNKIAGHRQSQPLVKIFLNATEHKSRILTSEIKQVMMNKYPDLMSVTEVPKQQAFFNASSYLFPITTYSKITRNSSRASAALDLLIKELGI